MTLRRTLWAAIILCALSLGAQANVSHPKAQEKAAKPALSLEEAALLRAEEAQAERVRKRDLEGYMKFYAHRDDLTLYDTEGTDAIIGWEACRKYWAEQFSGLRSVNKLELSKVRVHVVGDMGFVTATWTLEATTKDGDAMAQTGRLTDIWQKIEGKWLIVHEHSSLPFGNGGNLNVGKR